MIYPIGRLRLIATSLLATTAAIGTTIAVAAAPAAAAATSTVYVNPAGTGTTCTPSVPCTLIAGQARARVLAAKGNNVNVILANGRYQLASPLTFTSADSGKGAATVTYRAPGGSRPVITGAQLVTGWVPSTLGANIYEAPTPVGLDSRQLYVNGRVAPRAQVAVPASSVTLDSTGVTVNDPTLAATLDAVTAPTRVELESVLSFTDRYTPVAAISGNRLTMARPAWDNNTYGYDVIQHPFRAPQLYLENAPGLLSAAGQWYIDPAAGRLYYKAAPGQDPNTLDVELPTLQSVVQVSGTLAAPVRNLTFQGLTFTGTSWLHPSSPDGFASQQTGAYLTGADPNRPADAFNSCQVGCPGFEATRGKWGMIAGGVQVSAAQNITFSGNTFTNLGSQGLGIGNDGGANASGVDLGAQNITVTGNTFTQLSGGAVIVGGTQPNAHHPSDPRMTNENVSITNNTVSSVGVDYKDVAGIFATYVDGLTIDHNELSDLPYTGVATGYGWGSTDAGGSNEYANRGTYNYYPRYPADDPTTAQNYRVTDNYVHDIVTRMNDAGCFYTLGSVPNSLIDGNYCRDAGNGNLLYSWPIYLDEGSSHFTVSNNVFLRVPAGLHSNYSGTYSNHDLHASNNYLSANVATQDITNVPDSTNDNLVAITEPNIPSAASRIMFNSGALGHEPDTQRPPLGIDLSASSTTVSPGGSISVSTHMINVTPTDSVSSVKYTLNAPAGWTVTKTSGTPTSVPVTGTVTPTWRVTAPTLLTSSTPQAVTLNVTYASRGTTYTAIRTVSVTPQSPVTSLSTYTNASMSFAQFGTQYSITGSSGDTNELYGINSDSYGTIYQPASVGASATVTVRVDSYDNVGNGAKAGLVVRNDLTKPGASTGYAAVVVQGNGVTTFNDSNGNGKFDQYNIINGTPTAGPVWLRLTRSGSTLSAFWSSDGTTWQQAGQPMTLTNPATTLDAGMSWVTADPTKSGTATFDSFSVTSPTS